MQAAFLANLFLKLKSMPLLAAILFSQFVLGAA
jgi:hypothetical protein